MPNTRSRAPASSDVGDGEAEEQEGSVALQFNEPLTWRAGRAISVSDLLRRLRALSQELRDLEQEEAKRSSLVPVAQSLASNNLLQHKDRGVRAWTACCIVEMLRLCAPDAPYSGSQLKEIFNLFIGTIFPALADPSSPYNSQHLFVLKSLAEAKSVVLVTDIPSSSDLVERMFTCCFDVLSGPSKATTGEVLSKNVEHHMTAVLSTLVDESQGLPGEVLDVILAQFLRADPDTLGGGSAKAKKDSNTDDRQSTLILKEAPPAYNMAKNICNACAEKMARYISHYFSSIIVDTTPLEKPKQGKPRHNRRTSNDMVDSDDETTQATADADISESVKAHKLLRELWRSAPAVLTDVIPQLEMELSAENASLRILAAETLGDMVSGIGAGGCPAAPKPNPAAYPSQSVTGPMEQAAPYNFLTTPNSPHSFPSRYPQVFQSLLSRRNDRSPVVRSIFVTSIGRIMMTSAGGVGLDPDNERKLLQYFSEMLVDSDERVRLAAVKAIEQLSFESIIQKLGSFGGVADSGSVLSNLADRVKDRKPGVRTEAMRVLANIWGVAAGAIAEGSERVNTLLGPIPSRILDTYYINDPSINVSVESALYESLLPLSYPQVKSKSSRATSGPSRRDKQKTGNDDTINNELDHDKIRTERMLLLIKGLEPKAKTVMFAKQASQVAAAKFMDAFLKKCEEYNGGVMDEGEQETKSQLGRLIDAYSKTLPESWRASEDLWKYARMHDRRSYQLIRFCMAPDSDYKKVYRSIKEIVKRLQASSSSSSSTLQSALLPLVYRVSLLLYNRDHVPAIIDISRTDEKGLGGTAHEVIREISSNNPEILKAHISDLCKTLETGAPTSKEANSATAVDDLKACSGFAKKFPKDIPKDRKFMQSLVNYAVHGTPTKAAKHAVSIIMHCTDKKAMYGKDILRQCMTGLKPGSSNWISRLAALSEVIHLGKPELDDEDFEPVVDMAMEQVLDESSEQQEGGVDQSQISNYWALRILINRLRSLGATGSVSEKATPVYRQLNKVVADAGAAYSNDKSSSARQANLRLNAARSLLKLSCSKQLEPFLTPRSFNQLATVAQDPHPHVREGFVTKLMKYLGQDRISRRFYTIIFLLAFEPEWKIKDSALKWLRARSAAYAKIKDTTMEALIARLLSLLAHHPDFDQDVDNLKDFVQYILFYLTAVATQDNLSLIYHVAQRVKTVRDGIDNSKSENLYTLSDLCQGVIRRFEEIRGWSMQAWPGRQKMPGGIFAPLPSHQVSQQIATAQYLPPELVEDLDDLVKESLRPTKRKLDANGDRASKRHKSSKTSPSKSRTKKSKRKSANPPKTPRSKRVNDDETAVLSSERRRSGRVTGQKTYAESSDSADVMDDEDEEEEISEGGDDE